MDQYTVFAPTQADLLYLLADVGVLQGGQAEQGMGYSYQGPWALDGAALASVHALIWWHLPPEDEVEAQARGLLLGELRDRHALFEGAQHPTHIVGTSGPVPPTAHARIGMLRDARRQHAGVKVGEHWFHSDGASRDLYSQAAALVTLGANPNPVPWKTMAGAFVTMDLALLTQVLGALAISDHTHHAIAEQARAALAAGTLTDLSTIEWPAGYEASQ